MTTRRQLFAWIAAALVVRSAPGWAKDGASDSGDGHDNGGDNGNGSDNGNNGSTVGNWGRSRKKQPPGESDQSAARDAVSHGKAVSLREVLDAVDANIGGEVVDVKLVNSQGALRYDLTIIDRRGRLIEVSVDALTKAIRKVRGF